MDDYEDLAFGSGEENNAEPENRDVEEDGGENAAETAEPVPVKRKRVIRNPQPKLNAETLKGKRGLLALPEYFERVRFKGRGREEEDLNVVLKTYEYWCHRLFPKFPFNDCVEKIEKLGSKKAVATHVKKIRLDMAVEDENLIQNDDVDGDNGGDDDLFDGLLNDNAVEVPDSQVHLTEEQEERIRLNKERAERLRQETQNPSTSQTNLHQSDDGEEDEDLNSVFNKIRSLQQQPENRSGHRYSGQADSEITVSGENSRDSQQKSGESSGINPVEISQTQFSDVRDENSQNSLSSKVDLGAKQIARHTEISQTQFSDNSQNNHEHSVDNELIGHTGLSQSQSPGIVSNENSSVRNEASQEDFEDSLGSEKNLVINEDGSESSQEN